MLHEKLFLTPVELVERYNGKVTFCGFVSVCPLHKVSIYDKC